MKKRRIILIVLSIIIVGTAITLSVSFGHVLNSSVPKDKQILMGDDFVLAVNPNGTLFMRGAVGDTSIEDTCFGKWNNIYKIDGGGYIYRNYIAGLTKDGRVIVAKQKIEDDIAVDWEEIDLCTDWNDIIDITVNEYWIVGLKKDGTILFERTPLWETDIDTEWLANYLSWHDITSISVIDEYIIGLNREGTIVYNDQINQTFIPEEIFVQAATVRVGLSGRSRIVRSVFGITKDGNLFYSPIWYSWKLQSPQFTTDTFENKVVDVIIESQSDTFCLLFDDGSVVEYYPYNQEVLDAANINEMIGIDKVYAIYSGKYGVESGIIYFVKPNGEVYTFYNSDDHCELRESDSFYEYYSLDGYKMRVK